MKFQTHDIWHTQCQSQDEDQSLMQCNLFYIFLLSPL